MEMCRWLCFIYVNCFLIHYLGAKTVSLNELIAAESGQAAKKLLLLRVKDRKANPTSLPESITSESQEYQQPVKKSLRKITDRIANPGPLPESITSESQEEELQKRKSLRKFIGLSNRLSLFKRLASKAKIRRLNPGSLGNTVPEDKKISSLRYRKAFQIKSPLKPKKLKLTHKLRHKRRNQSIKREISENEYLKQKYIPLLKSLSMLFDNVLNSDESDSYEINIKKYKRNRFYSEEQVDTLNNWSDESSSRVAKSRSQQKATTPSPSSSIEISADTESLSSSQNYDYSTVRPNKNIPVLFPRNTFSSRRNDNGTSKRSSPTLYGNLEGNISRNHGNYEHNTRRRENKSSEEGDENNTYSVTRNDTSSIRHGRTNGDRNNTRISKDRETDDISPQVENTDDNVGKNQLQTRRDETESKKSIREPLRGLRRFVPQGKITQDERLLPEFIHPKEISKESILNATNDSAGHKRFVDKDGTSTSKDEKNRRRNETVILIETVRQNGNYSKGTIKNVPAVLIFDGYSVTRDKNGENKVSGKTIHVHS